jgi:ABC-type multidrug transport system fused ATPase/permease subunit
VKFHYPTKKDVEVLKGISIDVSRNKVIALVGPSGKNKFSKFNEYRMWEIKYNFYD